MLQANRNCINFLEFAFSYCLEMASVSYRLVYDEESNEHGHDANKRYRMTVTYPHNNSLNFQHNTASADFQGKGLLTTYWLSEKSGLGVSDGPSHSPDNST